MMVRPGQCMCGAIKFAVETSGGFSQCHCKMCQRWASGRFMGVQTNKFEIVEGKEKLTKFKSSDWAERAFCSVCGSNIYYHAADYGEPNVAIGTLDDTRGLKMNYSWFADLKPEAHEADQDAKIYTQEETEAFFGGQEE